MKAPARHLPVVAVLGIVTACAISPWWDAELRKWVGASEEELRHVWGGPVRTELGDQGQTIYVYTSSVTIDRKDEELEEVLRSDRTYENPPDLSQYPITAECEMFFEIEDGRVVGTSSEGGGCDPKIRPQ